MKKNTDTQGPIWEVFLQSKTGQPFRHAGGLHAFDKEMAIENARDLYCRRGEAVGLWVVPAAEIVAAAPDDAPAFFDPSDDKAYRHPTFYPMPDGVSNL